MVGVHGHVHAHSVEQSQSVCGLPLVLRVGREAVVGHVAEGAVLACERPAHGERHGSLLLQEVVVGGVAVVARTVFHIAVRCLGGFKACAESQIVVAYGDVEVVADVPALLVYSVLPCVRVVASRHIGVVLAVAVVGLHYLDVWEGGVALAVVGVVERERTAQLVADVLPPSAVKFSRERIDVVHLPPVASVEHHGVDAHASVAQSHSGTAESVVLLAVGLVVAQGEGVVFGNVPVHARHKSEKLVLAGEVVVGTWIPSVHRLQVGGELLHVALCHARNEVLAVLHSVLRTFPCMQLQRRVLKLRTDEEEELVLYYRTAEGKSVDGALDVWAVAQFLAIDLVAPKRLVLVEMVCRTAECVCSLLCHGVDACSHEVAVFHVEGRGDNLYVLEGLQSERSACSGHHLAVETHVGVEVSSVDAVVVHSRIASAEGSATYIIR